MHGAGSTPFWRVTSWGEGLEHLQYTVMLAHRVHEAVGSDDTRAVLWAVQEAIEDYRSLRRQHDPRVRPLPVGPFSHWR